VRPENQPKPNTLCKPLFYAFFYLKLKAKLALAPHSSSFHSSSYTRSLAHSRTTKLTNSFTLSPTLPLTHSLPHSHFHSDTHSPTHPLTHPSHSLTHHIAMTSTSTCNGNNNTDPPDRVCEILDDGAAAVSAKVEEVGGFLTDVLRLGPSHTHLHSLTSQNNHSDSDSGNGSGGECDVDADSDSDSAVLVLVVPGNPGTLAFYKGESPHSLTHSLTHSFICLCIHSGINSLIQYMCRFYHQSPQRCLYGVWKASATRGHCGGRTCQPSFRRAYARPAPRCPRLAEL
jgi:hypothetical protein